MQTIYDKLNKHGKIYVNDTKVGELLSLHYKGFIMNDIPIPFWKVTFSYTTNRGNEKKLTKYINLSEESWDLIDSTLERWVEEYNKNKPYRQISNATILDTEFVGNIYIEL